MDDLCGTLVARENDICFKAGPIRKIVLEYIKSAQVGARVIGVASIEHTTTFCEAYLCVGPSVIYFQGTFDRLSRPEIIQYMAPHHPMAISCETADYIIGLIESRGLVGLMNTMLDGIAFENKKRANGAASTASTASTIEALIKDNARLKQEIVRANEENAKILAKYQCVAETIGAVHVD